MFQGKVCWITGASSGIGEALAKQLAGHGASLILSGRNLAELDRVNAECGGDHLVLPFEATDLAVLPGVVDTATRWKGYIDGLINNAGISQRSLAQETDFSVYQQVIDIDLIAPIALTQAVLPVMLARGRGRIIMIASVAGLVGVPLRTAYCAAKHGLVGYADALRGEVAGQGIMVHVVAPGSVKTNVSVNALGPDGKPRGYSDDAIESGIDANDAATRILAGIGANQREIVVAEGMEETIVTLRRTDPNAAFDLGAALIAQGYAAKMGAAKAD